LLAIACTGVVFVAGAKLLDSVSEKPAAALGPYAGQVPRRLPLNRSRSTRRRKLTGSGSLPSLRKD
jgi:hypothetical protein